MTTPPGTPRRGPRAGGDPAHADDDEQQFLTALGTQVRAARERQGLSRRALAGQAGVSERYLAQLESGRGNASVLLLRRIALALRLDPGGLLQSGPGDGHPAGVALIGLRGAGKSTLGQIAACALGLPFVELNQRVVARSGLEMGEIFNLYGGEGFRRYERRCLDTLIEQGAPVLLATGGGIVAQPATLERLLASFFVVWLRASPREHMQRVLAQGDTRPMSGHEHAMDALQRILASRDALYARAHRQLDTSGRSVENCAGDLVRLLREAGF
jgi:XRE family aerobic/anaerobic benzoate catabolism transcriptional regulator